MVRARFLCTDKIASADKRDVCIDECRSVWIRFIVEVKRELKTNEKQEVSMIYRVHTSILMNAYFHQRLDIKMHTFIND